jgi:hypothetical protein
MPEYFLDVSCMPGQIIRVHQDVIEVYHDVDVHQIHEDRVKKVLKSGRCIGQTFQYNLEVVGAVVVTRSRW